MTPVIGSKLKDKTSESWLGALAGALYPGEEVTTLAKTNNLKPLLDGVAITTARVVGFLSSDVAQTGRLKLAVSAAEIEYVEVRAKRFGPGTLIITTRGGQEVSFGNLLDPDKDLVLGAAQQLAATGVPEQIGASMAAHAEAAQQMTNAWAGVEVVGKSPSDKAWKYIRDHATPGETPWFVIGAGMQGVLAAFDDRCMIIKTGAMTSMMAGSFGGGRVTTFSYSEITGIEYNSGMLTGVLEILTPSYQGSSNKDYWRGTNKSRNANSDDPWTLSNCLPLEKPLYQKALPRLNEMRSKITEAKRPTVVVQAQPAFAPSPAETGGLAAELTKLAALKDQGILDDFEFQAAKQATIARFTGG